MPMSKIKDIKLETTADYQSISGLNVQFWNQDKGTAILQFNITRNNYPLGLSEENVKVFIALESGDSFLVDDNLDYVDELNGVVAYTIPDDFMRVASKVTGQVYVTTLDEEEVVVQRQFTFNVANDLIADLPAEDKIREIKYFSDMRAEVAQMMEKLNNDFANMNDYVTQVEQTTQDGITALTNLIQQKQDAYNDNHTAKMKELNDTASEYSTKFDEDKEYMDDKFQAFQESVNGSGLITTGQSEDWQKYKLTSDDGKVQYLSKGTISNVLDLPTGIYETVSNDDATTQGLPVNNTYVQIKVLQMANNEERKIIEVTSTYNSKKWDRQLHTNGDRDTGWREVAYINPNNPFETVQGSQSKANTAESNAKTYTDSKVGELHKILFNGTVSNVGSKVNLLGSLYDYNMIVISGEAPGGVFNEVVLPATIKTSIMIQKSNLRDSDGEFLGVYEVKLEVTNGTTLIISNDVSYDMVYDSASGPNRNAYTINRIEGWK
ncbi:BppU family phage baseplate upper protein (plasmid) [Staphylococcus xylosus]|uniref:BppU family phage baseplate upper protein n=1 Tax=Staphylococcus xylosus TaxID=1288 RepID=UPI003CEBA845